MVASKFVVLRVVLARKSGVLDVADDAENEAIWAVKGPHALADGVLVRKESARERLANEDGVFGTLAVLLGEGSALDGLDSEDGKVTGCDLAMDDHAPGGGARIGGALPGGRSIWWSSCNLPEALFEGFEE